MQFPILLHIKRCESKARAGQLAPRLTGSWEEDYVTLGGTWLKVSVRARWRVQRARHSTGQELRAEAISLIARRGSTGSICRHRAVYGTRV